MLLQMSIFHSFLSAILILSHLLNKTLGHTDMNIAHGIVEDVILWCSRHARKLTKGLWDFPTSYILRNQSFHPPTQFSYYSVPASEVWLPVIPHLVESSSLPTSQARWEAPNPGLPISPAQGKLSIHTMKLRAEILSNHRIWERTLKPVSWNSVHKRQLDGPLGLKKEIMTIIVGHILSLASLLHLYQSKVSFSTLNS